MSDFENIPEVIQLVNGNINSELAFTYPAVLNVLAVCAKNRIAVLGVEIFQVVEGPRFQARGFSAYVFGDEAHHARYQSRGASIRLGAGLDARLAIRQRPSTPCCRDRKLRSPVERKDRRRKRYVF